MRKKPPFIYKLAYVLFIMILIISACSVMKSATGYMMYQYVNPWMHLLATLFFVALFVVLSGVAFLGHQVVECFEICQDYSFQGLKYAIGLVDIEKEFEKIVYVPLKEEA